MVRVHNLGIKLRVVGDIKRTDLGSRVKRHHAKKEILVRIDHPDSRLHPMPKVERPKHQEQDAKGRRGETLIEDPVEAVPTRSIFLTSR